MKVKFEQNPHNLKTYQGNSQIKAHDVSQPMTQLELDEYKKCAMDVKYFARNYVKIINLDHGLIDFDLYPYQEDMYDICDDNRFVIVLAPRQSGKSIAFVIYLLHFAIFNPDNTVLILANKLETAMEMLSRIELALENLPFFLQPGCKAVNKKSIEFSNKSKIVVRSANSNSARGISANLVYLDEFAFVDRAEHFYTSTYPIISSGKTTRVLITSTANGMGNVYHKLWRGARQKINEYIPFEVKWEDVPGRDEAWKAQTIANTSERQFSQEFENKFLGTSRTLIDDKKLLSLQAMSPIFESDNVNIYKKPIPEHRYVITSDVSEGIGGDYSTFSVQDVSVMPFEQVAAFKNNDISPYMLSELLVKYAKLYNEAYLVIENNDRGSLVNYVCLHDLNYDNIYAESMIKSNKLGLKTTVRSKRVGCSNLKDLVDQGKYIINDKYTIEELCTFEERNGSYSAAQGMHDDMVMTLVLFGYIASTQKFVNDFGVNLKDSLFSKEALDDLTTRDFPAFGIINKNDGKRQDEVLFEFEDEENDLSTRFKLDDVFGVVVEIEQDEIESMDYLF